MKRANWKTWVVLVTLALAIAIMPFAVACNNNAATTTPTTSAAAKEIKVGIITPSTGGAAFKGIPGQHGFTDAFEYINKELGASNGYQLKMVWYDSNYDKAKVATIVTDLMSQGVSMFVTMSSTEMSGAQEKANRAEFPGLVTYSSPSNYRPPAHIYGETPDYGDDFSAFINYYMKNVWKGTGKPKVALHLLNNTTGSGVGDAAKAIADKVGIDIVDTEQHTSTTISEIESLNRIKAKTPDLLFISSTDQATSVILKNARELGITPGVTVGLAHASFSKTLVDQAGASLLEGVYVSYPTVIWDDTAAAGLAKAKEYATKNNPNDIGNVDYLTCWATAQTINQIIKTAVKNSGIDAVAKGDVSAWRTVETQGFQKMSGYTVEGLQGPVSYTSGDNRLGKSLRVNMIKNGTLSPVTGWTEAPVIAYENFDWFGK